MGTMVWTKDPVTIVRDFETRNGQTWLSPLSMWAVWAVESLHYLDDLDASQADYPNAVGAHHADIVDIAHVRWAAGTAITALDLCAAALGRMYCGWSKKHEPDLRYFDLQARAKDAATLRRALPPPMSLWVDRVLADGRYKMIQDARNRFTHAFMNRSLIRGDEGGHRSRTQFRDGQSNTSWGSRDIVVAAKECASDHVDRFLREVDAI